MSSDLFGMGGGRDERAGASGGSGASGAPDGSGASGASDATGGAGADSAAGREPVAARRRPRLPRKPVAGLREHAGLPPHDVVAGGTVEPAWTERSRRLRGSRGKRDGSISLNLTSMIDVVFLLLVYFMVATEFKTGEEVYRLDLPDRARGAASDPFELDEEPVRVRVDTVRSGLRPYVVSIIGPYDQPGTFEELRVTLNSLNAAANTSGLFAADHPILVEPGRSADWEHALGAFNAAVRAGYVNVTLGPPR